MSDWLKTDPDNGCLIGPDGGHYENEHKAAHFGLLQLCGCGQPVEAFNFCRDLLKYFDRRDKSKEWIDAEGAAEGLIRQHPDVAAHVIAHLLTNLDLIEHGGSVGGSWLTRDGERIVDMEPMTEELMNASWPL